MPRAHRWVDECNSDLEMNKGKTLVVIAISGIEFECTSDDARDIGQTLIALADEIEAAAK